MLPNTSIPFSLLSLLQYSFRLPKWFQTILTCLTLSVFSAISPLWGLVKTTLQPYLDLDVLSKSPEQVFRAVSQFVAFIELNPDLVQDLQLSLIIYLCVHLIYMFLMWKMTLWIVDVIKHKVYIDMDVDASC